jgi:hypothetical protein
MYFSGGGLRARMFRDRQVAWAGLSYLGQQGGHVFLRRKVKSQDVQGLAGSQGGTVVFLLCVFIIILNTRSQL